MPDNQGLSHLSDHFLIVAVVLYSLAVIVFAADFAFGRRSTAVPQAEAAAPDLVPAGVAEEAGTARSGAVQDAAPRGAGSAGAPGAGPGRAGPASPVTGHGGKGGQPLAPMSRLVRIALLLTSAGLALHISGVITRGLAVHRVRGATCTSS